MIAMDACRILSLSVAEIPVTCDVKFARAPAVNVTLRYAATPSDISTVPIYRPIIRGASSANSIAEAPLRLRAKRCKNFGMRNFMTQRLIDKVRYGKLPSQREDGYCRSYCS